MKTFIETTVSRVFGELLVIALIPGALALALVARPGATGAPRGGPSAPSPAEAERLIAEAAARQALLWEPAPDVVPVDPRLQPAVVADVSPLDVTWEIRAMAPGSPVDPDETAEEPRRTPITMRIALVE